MPRTNDAEVPRTADAAVTADALLGAWQLVSWEITTGAEVVHPFGVDVQGVLIYTPDGVMQTMMMASNRPALSGRSVRASPDIEVAAAARSCFAYVGRWWLEGDEVCHEVTLALDPGLVGTTQRRRVRLGALLVLEADEPLRTRDHPDAPGPASGHPGVGHDPPRDTAAPGYRHHRLVWRRASDAPSH